jgi:hypothetical protein
VSFTPPVKGNSEKVDFQLYENGGATAAENLSLILDVN